MQCGARAHEVILRPLLKFPRRARLNLPALSVASCPQHQHARRRAERRSLAQHPVRVRVRVRARKRVSGAAQCIHSSIASRRRVHSLQQPAIPSTAQTFHQTWTSQRERGGRQPRQRETTGPRARSSSHRAARPLHPTREPARSDSQAH